MNYNSFFGWTKTTIIEVDITVPSKAIALNELHLCGILSLKLRIACHGNFFIFIYAIAN